MIPDVFYFIFLVKETDSYVQTWPTIRLEQWTFDLKSLWRVSFFVSTCFTLQTLEPLILFDNFLSKTVLVTANFTPGHLCKFWWYTHQVFAACATDETKL